MRKINLIVVHCSDSDIASHDNIETIRRWHVEERKWSDVGYHYFIDKAGEIHPGRNVATPGAHVAGHNAGSIGVCLSGRKLFNDSQFRSLESLLKKLCEKYGLDKKDILAHADLQPAKTCPNFDLHALLASWEWH